MSIVTRLFIYALFLGTTGLDAQTNTWTGSTDNNWHKPCNWSLNLTPTCSHNVVIPTVTTYPVITGIAHSLSLSITSAATNALTINSSGGARLDISSSGGSCSGTADNVSCFSCGGALAITHTSGVVAPETKTVSYGTVTSSLSGAANVGLLEIWVQPIREVQRQMQQKHQQAGIGSLTASGGINMMVQR